MVKETQLGQFAGLAISAVPSAAIAFLLVWVGLTLFGMVVLQFSLPRALLGGLAAAILHWVAETVHQLGHAWAARRSGHPMSGIRYWGLLSSSRYPKDEPELPATVHIQRALGGPQISFILSILAGALVLTLNARGGVVWWVALFFFLDNFLTFTIGSFLPLGFTDGSTLLYWRNKA